MPAKSVNRVTLNDESYSKLQAIADRMGIKPSAAMGAIITLCGSELLDRVNKSITPSHHTSCTPPSSLTPYTPPLPPPPPPTLDFTSPIEF